MSFFCCCNFCYKKKVGDENTTAQKRGKKTKTGWKNPSFFELYCISPGPPRELRDRPAEHDRERHHQHAPQQHRQHPRVVRAVRLAHQHVPADLEHVRGVPGHEDAQDHHHGGHDADGDGVVLVAFSPGLVGDAGDSCMRGESFFFFFKKK